MSDADDDKMIANLLWKVLLQPDVIYNSHDDNDNENNDDNDNINDDNNLLWQVSLQPDGTYKTESRLSFIATR